MKDARTSIEDLLDQMRPVLVEIGIPVEQINMRCGHHLIKTCNVAFDWLHDIFVSNEFQELLRIWNLLPENIWKRYRMHGFEDFREQILLSEAGRDVIKLWRCKRPRLFGKNRPRDLEMLDTMRGDVCRK